MSRHRDTRDDDWDDGSDDDETDDVDDSDGDDSGDEPTVPCPFCRQELLEDSPWCPSCDRFISDEDRQRGDRPLWVVVTTLVCLAIALWWAFVSF